MDSIFDVAKTIRVMARRARAEDTAGAEPAAKRAKAPWDEYLELTQGLLRNKNLFGADDRNFLDCVRKCLGADGREHLRVFRRRETEATTVQLDPVTPEAIVAETPTIYRAAEFLSRTVLVVHGSALTAAYNFILVIYGRVYGRVINGPVYIRADEIDVFQRSMIVTAPLKHGVQESSLIPGDFIATAAFSTKTSDLIAIAKPRSFFECIVFTYAAEDRTVWNPLSRAGRESIRNARTSYSTGSILMTGQRPPYSMDTITALACKTEDELDRLSKDARGRGAWRLFVEHVYGLLTPNPLARNLYGDDEWSEMSTACGSDASAFIHWLAFLVQTSKSTRCAPLFVSVGEQCGKGTLFFIIQRVLGPLMWMCSPDIFETQYQEEFIGRILIAVDEVAALFCGKGYETFKRYSGAANTSVGRKHKTAEESPGTFNFMLAANGGAIECKEEDATAQSRPWPLRVTGLLTDVDYYKRIYDAFNDPENCFDVYLGLSRFPLAAGFEPFSNRSLGIQANYTLMMTARYSLIIRRLHSAIVNETRNEFPLRDVVEAARGGIAVNSPVRRVLTDDPTRPEMREVLRHLAAMGLNECIGSGTDMILKRHIVRNPPKMYAGANKADFLAM